MNEIIKFTEQSLPELEKLAKAQVRRRFAASGRRVKEARGIAEQEHNQIQVRPARAGDIDGLLIIEQQCFNVYYYAFYTLDRRDFEFYLDDPDSLFLVAALDDRIVGYILGPIETWRDAPRRTHRQHRRAARDAAPKHRQPADRVLHAAGPPARLRDRHTRSLARQ